MGSSYHLFERKAHRAGFSLIELLVVVSVMGLLGVATFGYLSRMTELYTVSSDAKAAIRQASVLEQKLTRLLQADVIPASFRYMNSADTECLEWVPIRYQTRALEVLEPNNKQLRVIAIANDTSEHNEPFIPDMQGGDWRMLMAPASGDDVYNADASAHHQVTGCTDNGDDPQCSSLDSPDGILQVSTNESLPTVTLGAHVYLATNSELVCLNAQGLWWSQRSITAAATLPDNLGELIFRHSLSRASEGYPAFGLEHSADRQQVRIAIAMPVRAGEVEQYYLRQWVVAHGR